MLTSRPPDFFGVFFKTGSLVTPLSPWQARWAFMQNRGMLRLLVAAMVAGCGKTNPGDLIRVDGSSTVAPISEAMAESFGHQNRNVRITVGISGTGGGFKKFCNGETDISDASRPIQPPEAEVCKKNGIGYIELPVALDGIVVVVNPKNTEVRSLTLSEMKKLWEPSAQGKITKWNQIRSSFPNKEIHLFGPGVDSGTYDYFTAAVVGQVHSSRGDYTSSENDNILVTGVSNDEWSLGFFGYAYYKANQAKLRLLAIDDERGENGNGPIFPSPDTIRTGQYAPLSRPIFIYVSKKASLRPVVKGFVQAYLQGADLIKEVGYIPLSPGAYSAVSKRMSEGVIGSMFRDRSLLVGRPIEEILAQSEVRLGRPFMDPIGIQSTKWNRASTEMKEWLVGGVLFLCALVSVATTVGILWILFHETLLFFQEISPVSFFTDTQWTPLFSDKHFGIAPLLAGTVLTSLIALSIAVPFGILAAVYLSEYASKRVRRLLKPALELLAGIPTVVYGYFALVFLTPFLKSIWPTLAGFNGLSAGIAMGVMIMPVISSLSEDAIRAVPHSMREASYGLGAEKYATIIHVVLPASFSGIASSVLLGISRAIGETMIVAIAAGQQPRWTANPMVPIETMTAYIVQISLGDVENTGIAYRTIFAVASALFVFTLILNLISYWLRRRFQHRWGS
jgi:phosphate ABC transporter permease protein PstC